MWTLVVLTACIAAQNVPPSVPPQFAQTPSLSTPPVQLANEPSLTKSDPACNGIVQDGGPSCECLPEEVPRSLVMAVVALWRMRMIALAVIGCILAICCCCCCCYMLRRCYFHAVALPRHPDDRGGYRNEPRRDPHVRPRAHHPDRRREERDHPWGRSSSFFWFNRMRSWRDERGDHPGARSAADECRL